MIQPSKLSLLAYVLLIWLCQIQSFYWKKFIPHLTTFLDGDHPDFEPENSFNESAVSELALENGCNNLAAVSARIQSIANLTNITNATSSVAPVIVGVCGGSGSGKTFLAEAIIAALGKDHVVYISHDSYYKDLSHLNVKQRAETNFDHPDSLDSALLRSHLIDLKAGKSVNVPNYDFTIHSRTSKVTQVDPRPVVLVDGILIFAEPLLVDFIDMKIFVDTDDDIRLIRRIRRDTVERKRTINSIIEQYIKTVRPMHQLYVEPSKRKADIIVPAEELQTVALDMCVSSLREVIQRSGVMNDLKTQQI